MATPPVNPGDIVSVPDPVTGGVGAAVTVAQIVNTKWRNAVTLLNNSSERADDAIAVTDPAPQMPLTDLDTSYLMPIKPVLPDNNPADAKAIFDDARADIHDEITSGFVDYLTTYFPDRSYFDNAIAWINRALTTGGTGINSAVEQQLYERGRARLTIEAARAKADLMQGFANRGFPLPPGALVHGAQLVDQDMRNKLAEQSRDITIEAFRAELENTRFAVQQALDLWMKAIASAGDYIRTLLQGDQVAASLATAMVSVRSDLARNLVALYQAESAALEPRVRLAIADAQIQQAGNEANLRSKIQVMGDRVQAAIAALTSTTQVAAASLNGIGAGASISGGDSSSV
jgi:hypothetical protein